MWISALSFSQHSWDLCKFKISIFSEFCKPCKHALCPTASHICTVRMFFVFAHKLLHFMGQQDEISVCTFVAKVSLFWNPHKRDCLTRWTILRMPIKCFCMCARRLHKFEIPSTMKVLPETLLIFAFSLVDFHALYVYPILDKYKKIRQ